jgi:hypothetical protein
VAALLGALGAWLLAAPYLGPALGLVLDVPPIVEVVDHVVPGLIVVTLSGASLLGGAPLLSVGARGGAPGGFLTLAVPGLAFLAGLWGTSTHVPLVADAWAGEAPWGAALFHSVPGILIAVLSLALFLIALRSPPPCGGAAR